MKGFLKNVATGIAFGIGFLVVISVTAFIVVALAFRMDTGAISPADQQTVLLGKRIDPTDIMLGPVTTSSGFASSLIVKTSIQNLSDQVYENIHVQAFILVNDILVNSCSENYYSAIEPGGTASISISCRYTNAEAAEIVDIELKITEANYAISL